MEAEEKGVAIDVGLVLLKAAKRLNSRLNRAPRAGGVVVQSIDPGSAAEECGLRPGDVLLELEFEKVSFPGDVEKAIRNSKGGIDSTGYPLPGFVLLSVERFGQQKFLKLNR